MINEILLWKFLKFCIVGSSGMIIDFGTTWLLKEKVRINKYIANSTGFILAATSNYLLNRFWTFQSANMEVVSEYLTFILISVVGLGLSNFFVYVFNERLKFNFYLSKLFAISIVILWNFTMNYLYTFT